MLLWGLAAAGVLMFVVWLMHFPLRNAAIVDAGWAAGLALLALLYTLLDGGNPRRAWLLTAMAGIWGLRLSVHLLADRIVGKPEEGRYQELRRNWRTHIPLKFLLFFEFQAALCVLLSIPFLLAIRNPAPELGFWEYSGVLIWAAGMAGETIADRQLSSFKANPANRGLTCRNGLWRYTRHPNYFFEWLIWIGYAVFATPAPGGHLAWSAPALILYFLLRVTGIPATEAHALRSRRDYAAYQRTTSAFFPWFPAN
jgi:steroid 5-alpha reductase family enzyme